MKKYKIISFFLSFVILGLYTVPVLAIAIANPVSSKYGDLAKIIGSAFDWVRVLAAIALLGYTTYGGYTKLTAGGDAEKDKQAMLIIRNGVIGFTIIMIAPIVVRTIGAILGVKNILG
ncbi:MAG: hypothetical protein WCJ58_02840 [bacterium]